MNYRFESTGNGEYQVRLKGEFVCYSDHKNAAEIDTYLKEEGFASREEFFKASVEYNLGL